MASVFPVFQAMLSTLPVFWPHSLLSASAPVGGLPCLANWLSKGVTLQTLLPTFLAGKRSKRVYSSEWHDVVILFVHTDPKILQHFVDFVNWHCTSAIFLANSLGLISSLPDFLGSTPDGLFRKSPKQCYGFLLIRHDAQKLFLSWNRLVKYVVTSRRFPLFCPSFVSIFVRKTKGSKLR